VTVLLRPFRQSDAPALAEWIDRLGLAEEVCTPAWLVHQRRMMPSRGKSMWLVAVMGREPVGLAREDPQIFASRLGVRRTWVGVRPDVRSRGIGGQLWAAVERHARQIGARTLRSWAVGEGSPGEQFLRARGFKLVERELQSWVDPSSLDETQLERVVATAAERGFRVVGLDRMISSREADLRRVFLGADGDAPGHAASQPVAAGTFRRVILQNPLLDLECSTVVLHGDEPVALSWLKGDREVGRYGVEFTGTASSWRGRGLAYLAKLSALRLVARAGVRWVGTANDQNNAPMLAINRRLKHRPLPDLLIYERELAPESEG
jgi:GNAT superfamily N-acetyltransferase